MFSRRWKFGLRSFGLRRHTTCYVVTDISEEHTVSVYSFLRNADKHLTGYMMSLPRRQRSWFFLSRLKTKIDTAKTNILLHILTQSYISILISSPSTYRYFLRHLFSVVKMAVIPHHINRNEYCLVSTMRIEFVMSSWKQMYLLEILFILSHLKCVILLCKVQQSCFCIKPT
jgi:hypothetical protein